MKTKKIQFNFQKNSIKFKPFSKVLSIFLVLTISYTKLENGNCEHQEDLFLKREALNQKFTDNRLELLQTFTIYACVGEILFGKQGTTIIQNSVEVMGAPQLGIKTKLL